MAWVPGQSGNPDGVKKVGKWRDMLDRAIASDDSKRLRAAAEALLDAAAAGDLPAIKELADRLDGKPSQQIVATDQEGRQLAIGLIAYLRPDDSVQVSTPAIPAPDTPSTGQRH